MKQIIIRFLIKIDLFDRLKLLKDRFLLNTTEKINIEKRITFYSKLIHKNDLCFDIGASYGNRTAIFLGLGARVVSVEPQRIPAKFLRRKFNDRIVLITKALGAIHSYQDMYISEASALSTLSRDWLTKVKDDRFRQIKWDQKTEVEVITLDDLISQYGKPNFCKIDVEGYELEVLKGLTQPLETLSFEFTMPEYTDNAIECLNYLNALGAIICNYSSGETMEFGLTEWLPLDGFIKLFLELGEKNVRDGDIYVKFF
jgi:FkbM family methyltransferase